jgi:hypothetical protein
MGGGPPCFDEADRQLVRYRLQAKHSGLRVWQGNGVCARGCIGLRGKDSKLTPGSDACDRCGKRGFHVVHRAQGNDVEAPVGGHGLYATGPDLGGEVERPDDLAKEGRLLVLGFGEGHGDLGAKKGYGQTGKTGSRAEVKEGPDAGVKVAASKEALAKVAADDLLRIADGREIGAGVPFEEEVEVSGEVGKEVSGDFGKVGNEEPGYCGF